MPNGQPNPSFWVLTMPRSAVPKAEKKIRDFLKGESGGILKPITRDKYVLARPAQLAMRTKYDTHFLMRDFLKGLPGVIWVTSFTGDQVKKAYEIGMLDPDDNNTTDLFPVAGYAEHLEVVHAKEAWGLLRKKTGWEKDLAAVWVAHLDTGVTKHPVFGTWKNGTTATVRPDLGINYMDGGGPPFDPVDVNYAGQRGHGTRTLSTLAGTNKKTLLGMAHGATFVPYRVTNTSVIDTFSATPLNKALDHAWSQNGCRVASISLGDPCNPSPTNTLALYEAYRNGMIVVAAAGNVTSEVTFPGSHPCTITAGGVNLDKTPWAGGSRGARVDLCAPANGIFRAETVALDPKKPDYVYGKQGDGTSYATTAIAGAAALWLARWTIPYLETVYTQPWMFVEAFRMVARSSVTVPAWWDSSRFGAGVLDAHVLLQTTLPNPAQLTSRLP